MTRPFSDWMYLPVEILQNIFQFFSTEQLDRLTLVCKPWSHTAQTLFYSQVCVHSPSQIEKFYETVERNSLLGEMVRNFEIQEHFFLKVHPDDLDTAIRSAINTLTILLSDYLPNLEVLQDCALGSYIPVLDALTNCQLRRLRSLNTPSCFAEMGEIADYVTCALLMKDRLQNLFLSDGFESWEESNIEQSLFSRLRSKLDKFERLENLEIRKVTNEGIQLLDDIINSCRSLKSITFNFEPSGTDAPLNQTISIDKMAHFAPKSTISTLKTHANSSLDGKTLAYIMHKFPRLEEISLQKMGFRSYLLSESTLTQLFHYLSSIEDVSVECLDVDHNTVTKSCGSFWDTTSALGSKHVQFRYMRSLTEDSICIYNAKVIILYATSSTEWKHTGFLRENGKYIKEVLFDLSLSGYHSSRSCELPVDFVDHTFINCPYLQILKLQNCALRKFVVRSSAILSLEELVIDDCVLYSEALEMLSLGLSHLKRLKIGAVIYNTTSEENNKPIASEVVSMSHTKIDLVVLGVPYEESRYIKIFSAGETKCFYYHVRFGRQDLKMSNEEEYTNAEDDERVCIRCLNSPALEVKSGRYLR